MHQSLKWLKNQMDLLRMPKLNGSGEYNRSQSERLEFWNRFNEIVAGKRKPFNVRKASTDHWYDIAIGVSGCHVALNLVYK